MAAPIPLAKVEELSDWLGEPIIELADTRRAELALRFASALVRRESGRNWVAEDGSLLPTLPDDVALVTLTVAARGYSNPEGWEDEAVDDWRGRRDLDEIGMHLTRSEKDLLAQFAGKSFRGLGTVSTTRGPVFDTEHETWVVNGPHTYLDDDECWP